MPTTKKITELSLASVAAGDDVPIAQGGFLKRAKAGQAGGLAILGAAGMPLNGAGQPVVASGSNSNGTYVRFADGTQICYLRLEIFGYDSNFYVIREGAYVWNFPAAFIDVPTISCSFEVQFWKRPWNDTGMPDYGGGMIAEYDNSAQIATSTTRVQFKYYFREWGGVLRINGIAIGRWY